MICYVCYGSENFGLESLHDDNVGLAGATPQFYSVAPYRFDYSFHSPYLFEIYFIITLLYRSIHLAGLPSRFSDESFVCIAHLLPPILAKTDLIS